METESHRILLMSSSRDSDGLVALDQRGNPTSMHFKSSRMDRNTLTVVRKGQDSLQGMGSAGDFIVAAQADKPLIHFYQFGKAEPVLHVHTQEINTCLTTDRLGSLLFSGSKKGNLFVWDLTNGELINSWQGHFKAVSKMAVSMDGQVLVTLGEDGLGRAWMLSQALDSQSKTFKTMQPYRSWNAHTLSITGMCLLDSATSLRVWTCSLDRHLCLHDIHSNRTILRLTFPQALETIACSEGRDMLLVGGSAGGLYALDTHIIAAALHVKVEAKASMLSADEELLPHGVTAFPSGLHGRHAITSVTMLPNLPLAVSTDATGKVCWWDLLTRACVREVANVFSGSGSKAAVTNCLLLRRAQQGIVQHTQSAKATLPAPCPLKKYMSNTAEGGAASGCLSLWVSPQGVIDELSKKQIALAPIAPHVQQMPEAVQHDAIAENDDFLPLPPVPSTAEAAEEDEDQDEAAALEQANNRIAELEKDNQRWEAVCAKMQAHIQQMQMQGQQQGQAAPQQQSKKGKTAAPAAASTATMNEDVGDAPEVVSAWQAADVGKKAANKAQKRKQSDDSTSAGSKKDNKIAKK